MRIATVGTMCVAVVLSTVSSVTAQSFSLDAISPSVAGGFVGPSDIFIVAGPGIPPILPVPSLVITGDTAGPEVNAISYGRTLSEFSTTAPAFFSVDLSSTGVAGTAVAIEFGGAGSGSEASSDVFASSYGGSNALVLDGDGLAITPNPAVPALGVTEPASTTPIVTLPSATGDVDGFDLRSPALGPAGSPTGVIYFSVDTATAVTGLFYGTAVSAADVFIGVGLAGYDSPSGGTGSATLPTSPSGTSQPYVTEIGLGFGALLGNDIDALVVYDNGDGSYTPGTDIVAFSLKPGSTYLGTPDSVLGIAVSPGDILVDGMTAVSLLGASTPAPGILHTAESLGLLTVRSTLSLSDSDLNALDMAVPEPSTVALALIAGLSLFGYNRRRA